MMKRLILVAATAGLAATANAATISFSYFNPSQNTEIHQTGNLGLFDSSLGTLTGAQLVVSGAASTTLTATNVSPQNQTATLTTDLELFWTSSLASLTPFISDSILFSSSTGSLVYAPGQSRTFGPMNSANNNIDDLSSILASLQNVGGGVFSLSCESLTGLTIRGGGGNISTSQATTASCGASITYTYTPGEVSVPEPASLALLGLGLVGLGALRRRRAA